MARMIPEVFDESTPSVAERTLYYALQDGLDRDWTVIHALSWVDNGGRFLRQGETDFVVLHPERGLLALEVKSGAPRYDRRRGVWLHDDGHPMKDPFDQARQAGHHLNRLLGERAAGWREAGLPFGYAVAFPDASAVVGGLLPEMTPHLIILEPDLARIQTRLEAVLDRFGTVSGGQAAATGVMRSALDALQPEFGLVPAFAAGPDTVERELVRLTREQLRVLDHLGANTRLLVRGGAGTGKTLLVVEQARRHAAAGRSVLVLCYNNSLEARLKEWLGDLDQVDVHTFHGLCMRIVTETGAEFPVPEDPGARRAYWSEDLPARACDILDDWPTRYDAVLVDEAQDFLPGWWVPVEGLLKDPAASQLLIVGDERQDLYHRGAELPFTQPVCDLDRNCRNTRQIAAWVHETADLDAPVDLDLLPSGPEVEVIEVADAAAEAEAVRKTLHRMIHDHGLSPDRIAILGKHRIEKSSLAERRKLGNVQVVAEGEDGGPGCVRYTTIHKYKGLEADCVLLIGVGEPSSYFTPEDEKRFLYVGGTRAKWGLVVFRRGEG